MSWVRSISGALVFASMIALTGCGASTSLVDEDVESADDEISSGAKGAHFRGHHPPPGAMLLMTALQELELSDAQKTEIEGMLDAGRPKDRKDHEARARELAAAIRTGTVDVASLKGSGPAPMHEKMAANLDRLHALLSAEQRQSLVTALNEKKREHEANHDAEHGPKGARGRGPKGDPMKFMLRDLDVTDAQQKAIQSALTQAGLGPQEAGFESKRSEMRAKFEKALNDFAGNDFSAKASLPAPDEAHGPAKMLEALAVVVPLLTAEQREKLADRIEAGPPHPERRRGG
jgi:Spy/CpxP family protein refolding chaperone